MSTKRWIIILGAFVVILSAAMCVISMIRPDTKTAGVFQDGVLLYEIDVSDHEAEYTVTYDGRDNVIRVENGEIYMAHADCPDQVCVLHGPLKGAEPIVCLPNRLIVRWMDNSDWEIDAVTGR